MKLFRSAKNPQPAAGLAEGPASLPFQPSPLGAAGATLGLDDFGIIGTHHLPLDWLGSSGEATESSAGPFPC